MDTDKERVPSGTVVVGVDGSVPGESAPAWAAEEAHLAKRTVTLVHAITPLAVHQQASLIDVGNSPSSILQNARSAGHRLLGHAAEHIRERYPDLPVMTYDCEHDPRSVMVVPSPPQQVEFNQSHATLAEHER